MKLKELIAIVDDAYPDGLVGQWFDDPDGFHGDTLAEFIVRELKETFSPKATSGEQTAEAIRVMSVARQKLDDVIKALGAKKTAEPKTTRTMRPNPTCKEGYHSRRHDEDPTCHKTHGGDTPCEPEEPGAK